MKYRIVYISLGIGIMVIDTVLAIRYQKPLIYSFWGSFLGFSIPFGIGLSMFLYGAFKARDYGVNPVIGIFGTGGFTRAFRQTRIQGTRTWKFDHDVLSGLPGATKSPDGKTVEYSNIFIKKPIGSSKHSRLLDEAAQKYINGELDDEGFYRYVGKHTWKEEQILDFVKKFRKQ